MQKKNPPATATHMQKSLYSRRLKCFFVCLFILIQFLSSGTHIVAPKMENKLFRSSARAKLKELKKKLVKSNVIPLKQVHELSILVLKVDCCYFFYFACFTLFSDFAVLCRLNTRNYSYRCVCVCNETDLNLLIWQTCLDFPTLALYQQTKHTYTQRETILRVRWANSRDIWNSMHVTTCTVFDS